MNHLLRVFRFENIYQGSWQGALDRRLARRDAAILARFAANPPWGMDTAIDLIGCDLTRIGEEKVVEAFSLDLCEKIKMKRFGDPQIVRFGNQPQLEGITLIQLIETSDIAAHFIDWYRAGCLNVFSCAPYPPYQTAELCRQWFGAQAVKLTILFRGPYEQDHP